MKKYPWQAIDPKDYIQIEATEGLTMKGVHVLTKLYQPLIGAKAHALYLTLFSDIAFEPNTKGVTVSELLRKLDIGIPDFYQARVRLEGIGLLRIYRSKEETGDYFYQMIPPLTAKNFLKDSLLRTLLIEKIGDRLFKEALESLLPEAKDKQRYEEVTRSFLDVYHFDVSNTDVLSQTDFMPFETNQPPKIAETIENVDTFDYDFFKAGLNKHFVRQDSFTKEIKELIYTFHVVYGIDEMTMQALILESADVESGEVNKNKFISSVQRSYLNKQQTKPKNSQKILQTKNLNHETLGSDETKETCNNQGRHSQTGQSVINHAKLNARTEY